MKKEHRQIASQTVEIFIIPDKRTYNKFMKLYEKIQNLIDKYSPRYGFDINFLPEHIRPTMWDVVQLHDLIMYSLLDYNYRHSKSEK